MNWDALGAIGELVGAVAVLLTLIYLAVQTRLARIASEETRKLVALEAVVGRLSQMEVAHTEFANSEHLPRISVEIQRSGIQSLTAEDLERLKFWEGAVKLRMASQYVQYEAGLLDQKNGEAILKGAVARRELWQELDVIRDIGSNFESAVELAAKQ